jgi:tRNA 2-thiouridine synthesizing protein E
MEDFNPERTSFDVDDAGFLIHPDHWNQRFVELKAAEVGILGGITREHWDVINFIRSMFRIAGRTPLVYECCRQCGLTRVELQKLFPAGYLRGACKLAGITYREGYISQTYVPETTEDVEQITLKKTYVVDVRGFLVDPGNWDEYYAAYRAHDMKYPGGRLTDDQWRVIRYVRAHYARTGEVPTVYETCEANQIELEDLESMFPDGYHRGLIKISGLRVR